MVASPLNSLPSGVTTLSVSITASYSASAFIFSARSTASSIDPTM